MNNIVVLGGSSHPNLVNSICFNLGIQPSQVKLGKFSNGETSISIGESVREKDVYVIQSGCGHVNDNFIEFLILINACKTSSASRVTAVMPYFCYSRQPDIPCTIKNLSPVSNCSLKSSSETNLFSTSSPDSKNVRCITETNIEPSDYERRNDSHCKTQNRIPIVSNHGDHITENGQCLFNSSNSGYKLWIAQSSTLIANLLTTAGADHVITMDLHDSQFQGYFDIPVDNLYCKPLAQVYIQRQIPNYTDAVIVSPDAGGAKRAAKIADALKLSFALIHKERRSQLLRGPPDATLASGGNISSSSSVESTNMSQCPSKFVNTTMLVGDVHNKICILVDDLVDTSYTITRAAKLLKEQGATKVYAIITHGIFSGDALNRILESSIDKIITTNTIPQEKTIAILGKERVDIMDVSSVFGEAIRRIHNGESISMLFEHDW